MNAGESKTLGIDFRPRDLARLDVTVTGGAGAAEILLDGKRTGVPAPGTIYLGPGNHRIHLALDGWNTAEGQQTIKFKAGQARTVNFTLQRP
jgi:hypothetical protein